MLEDVVLNPTLACELDPSIKTQQTEVMSNRDVLIVEPPQFEIYKTRISCGHDKEIISTDVLGIKCALDKGHLLKEFFNQSSVLTDIDTRLGTFVPTGAVHLIGLDAYAKLLREHNQFLHTVTTVSIGDFQYAKLEIPFSTDATTDIDQTDLTEIIMSQPWCLSIKCSTTLNKVILITTIANLSTARTWVDDTLPAVYRQHISDKLDVTTMTQIIPCRLDKPILTSASCTYASQLKQCPDQATMTPTTHQPLNCPLKSKIVKPADITFTEATTKNSSSTQNKPTTTTTTQTMASTPATETFDQQSELQKMAHEVETTLQAKFNKVFAKMQQSLDNMELNVEKKIQSHMDQLQATQADKATQENHSKQLDMLTKTLKILLRQVNMLLDQQNNPTPMNGVGDS